MGQSATELFDAGSVSIAPPASKFLGLDPFLSLLFSRVQAFHQTGAVGRSKEDRTRETAFGPSGAEANTQPLPHNPRKHRENPAAAGSRDYFHRSNWRRGRDSRPRAARKNRAKNQRLGTFSIHDMDHPSGSRQGPDDRRQRDVGPLSLRLPVRKSTHCRTHPVVQPPLLIVVCFNEAPALRPGKSADCHLRGREGRDLT